MMLSEWNLYLFAPEAIGRDIGMPEKRVHADYLLVLVCQWTAREMIDSNEVLTSGNYWNSM